MDPIPGPTSFAAAKREASSLTAASFGVDFLLAPLLLDLPDNKGTLDVSKCHKLQDPEFELRLKKTPTQKHTDWIRMKEHKKPSTHKPKHVNHGNI